MWIPTTKELVLNKNSHKIGRVTEVDEKWGWFKVHYTEDTFKVYTLFREDKDMQVRPLTSEEKADLRLRQETHGFTNSWQES